LSDLAEIVKGLKEPLVLEKSHNLDYDLPFYTFTQMLPASPICLGALGCAARLHGAVEVGACGAV